MDNISNKYQKYTILQQTQQIIDQHNYKDTAIVTNNIVTLQKLEIILSQNKISLFYKKPFIKNQYASLLINSLDLIIHDFKTIYLLYILKNPLIYINHKKIVTFIENHSFRCIKYKTGFLGIKENLYNMPDALKFINNIEYHLLLLKNIKNTMISTYINLTLKYLMNFITITKELHSLFQTIINEVSYPICSISEYKSILIYFMQKFYTENQHKNNVLYAFEYKEIPFIEEHNIIVFDQEFQLINPFIDKKNIIKIKDKIENNHFTINNKKNIINFNPPIELRPKILTATMIKHLIKSPYDFCLKYIFKISELNQINRKPSILEFGNILHEIFAKFTTNNQIIFEEILQYSQDKLKKHSYSYVKYIWVNKIKKIIEQFVYFHNTRINNTYKIESEKTFLTKIANIEISARLDRIEYSIDDTLSIIDYKTGHIPTQSDLINYNEPQLFIQAIVLSDNINNQINELCYIKFEENSFNISTVKNLNEIEKFRNFLTELIETYINKQTPFTQNI